MIIKQTKKWVIMDKQRKVIAVGASKNRQLVMLNSNFKARIATYNSKKIAESMFKHGFYDHSVWRYFKETYSKEHVGKWDTHESIIDYLEGVPVLITIEE